jgi:chemotaxis protein MotB
MKNLLLTVIALLSLSACVSKKQHDAMILDRDRLDKEVISQRKSIESLNGKNDALSTELETMRAEMAVLSNDTATAGGEIRKAQERILQLNDLINDLIKTNETISSNSMAENARLARELKQNELLVKRKEAELAELEKDLESREKKVKELQTTLDAKDAAVRKLRETVARALLGFENSGLTVVEKNGKVYVSLSEQLLFKTGSANIDPRGRQAIIELGKVLEINPDISIMVEGHTDDQGADDVNWDLSVRRATSIIKILSENPKINPSRMTAAGRGKHMPVDSAKTAEARAKNRRTEIILTPKLDDLFRIIESN